MQSEEIEITILPDGRIEYTIKGVKGEACASVSEVLERLGHVEHEERTGEYYEESDHAGISIDLG
jgi:hypothetical protein